MGAEFVAAYLSAENGVWAPTGTIACNGVTGGNHLTVLTKRNNVADFVTGISDGVNSYALVKHQHGGTDQDDEIEMWEAYNVTGGNLSVVVTLNGGGSGCSGAVIESSGVLATGEPLDQNAGAATGAIAQTLTVGPVTPTTDGQMCILVGLGQVDARPFLTPAGWTKRVDMVASGTYFSVWTYVQPAAAAIGTNILDTTPNNQRMCGIIGTFKAAGGTCALTGTATASITRTDVFHGDKTVILTLTGDTYVAAGAAFNAERQALINGGTSAQSEPHGWNAEVKAKLPVTSVARTSDTVATVTLTGQPGIDINAIETITWTVPASTLTGAAPLVATPAFTVTPVARGIWRPMPHTQRMG